MQPRKNATGRSEDTKVENKMSREDRAKQFMPFAAVKGYPEAMRKKEKEALPGAKK